MPASTVHGVLTVARRAPHAGCMTDTDMLIAAARLGLAEPATAEIGRRARLAPETVRAVMHGRRASEASRRAVLAVLGLAPAATPEQG